VSEALRVGVLVSGTGTNLQALIDKVHGREAEIVAVASNAPDADALERAAAAGVHTRVFAAEDFGGDRAARDAAMAEWLVERRVELVVLAGYMQPRAVINVHPALLPAFPGVRAIEQAIEYGVKVFGVTVHFVDEGVDTGPVILQRSLELANASDPDDVRARLRPLEHELLPEAVRLIARGALSTDPDNPRRVVVAE